MKKGAAVLGAAVASRADPAQLRAEPGAASAGHHEADAVVYVVVERKAVGTADETHAAPPGELHELNLPLAESPVLVWRVGAA